MHGVRYTSTCESDNPEGEQVTGFKAFDESHEADFVVQEISSKLHQGTPPSEIAVFYRTNAQSRSIEEALVASGIAYEIFGGHRFYERKEIKDIMAYLKVLVNPDDNESLLRIINTPARGLGATSVGKVIALAGSNNTSVFQALAEIVKPENKLFTEAVKKKFKGFLALIDTLGDELDKAQGLLSGHFEQANYEDTSHALSQLIQVIAEKSTYLKKLKAEDSLEAESRIENIHELMSVAVEFVRKERTEQKTPTVEDFLDRASLASDLDKDANTEVQAKPISLMTLHLAKGLEFDTVFMLGLEEGLLPHSRSLDDQVQLEEERRLCYVGITRARKSLFLTRARSRQTFGRGNFFGGVPSRFIEDLPESCIEDRNTGFLELY